MAEAPDKPVYLLTGSDRPKIEKALSRLRAHFEPEAIEVVTTADTSGAEAVALCNAGSLFGDRRLVVVEQVDGWSDSEGRRKGGWKAADVDAVVAYLDSPAPDTVLALVAEALKKTTALWKVCEKTGQILDFDVEQKKLHGWVLEQFRQRNVRAEPEAANELIQLVGADPQVLAVEIDKLATWAQGEPVGEREVRALVAPTADLPIYELTEAWAVRDTERALAASETLLERESRQRRDTSARLAGALGGHLARLRAVKRLAAEGKASKEIAGELRLHPFRTQKLLGQAESFSTAELGDATQELAALDGALKGQSKLAPDLELQRALIELTRSPGAPSAK